jgi:hypothetical protein
MIPLLIGTVALLVTVYLLVQYRKKARIREAEELLSNAETEEEVLEALLILKTKYKDIAKLTKKLER